MPHPGADEKSGERKPVEGQGAREEPARAHADPDALTDGPGSLTGELEDGSAPAEQLRINARTATSPAQAACALIETIEL